MDLDRPLPAEWTVRAARDAYLAENGFSLEAYDAPWTKATFLGITVVVPNTARHRFAIMLHDLHHVATGYGTDLVGEGEISAWELRSVPALGLYVGGIVTFGSVMGAVLAPRRFVAALTAGKRQRRLFDLVTSEASYEALLDETVGGLRRLLEVPEGGLADRPRRLHVHAPRAALVAGSAPAARAPEVARE
jgi:hypothetical protein